MGREIDMQTEGGPSRHEGEILPIDYQIIGSMIRKRDKVIVEMEDELLDESLCSEIVDPRTGETMEFGYLYQWKIHVRTYLETLEDSDGTERGEYLWISDAELRKLEGYVIRFFLEGNSFGEYYLDEAAYLVRDGELVPAPEYLANRSKSETSE
jgi:hypothetical protein